MALGGPFEKQYSRFNTVNCPKGLMVCAGRVLDVHNDHADLSCFFNRLIFTTVPSIFSLWSRLAKSTLTLIPLLGIHAILFTFVIDESVPKGSILRLVRLFCDLLFNSFQVRTLVHVKIKPHFFKRLSFEHVCFF